MTDEQQRKLDEMLNKARESMSRLADICMDNCRQLAADMGEPYSESNGSYWAVMSNLIKSNGGALNSDAPELYAMHRLAKSIVPMHYPLWGQAHAIADRLYDDGNTGEELGLGQLLRHTFDTAEDRAAALHKCAVFHKVPALYELALAHVVEAIMLANTDRWQGVDHPLPQPWAQTYTTCVMAISERCKNSADDMENDICGT